MDLIDTLSATTADSIVKLSLSHLFRRKYSSLTDVLSSVFRTNLKMEPTVEERQNQTMNVLLNKLLSNFLRSHTLTKEGYVNGDAGPTI